MATGQTGTVVDANGNISKYSDDGLWPDEPYLLPVKDRDRVVVVNGL